MLVSAVVVAMVVVAARRRNDDDRTAVVWAERLVVVPAEMRALHHGAGGKSHGRQ